MQKRLSDRKRFSVTKFCIMKAVLGHVPQLEITRDEYRATTRAHQRIKLELRLESALDYLIASYKELEHDCLRLTLDAGLDQRFDYHEALDGVQLIDRRVFNLLASARAYLDKSCSIVGQIGGTYLHQSFKNKLRNEYDSSFSYRLLEALRNHTQHAGLSVSTLSRHSSLETLANNDDPDTKRRIVKVTRPRLAASELQQNSKIKKQIREEIGDYADKDGNVDLLVHIRQYVSNIGRSHEWLRTQTILTSDAARSQLKQMIDRYRDKNGDDILGLSCMALSSNNIAAQQFPLFEKWIDRIDRFRQKNAHISRIHELIISNEFPLRVRE